MRVGEVDLLVETVLVAGTEPTSGLDKVGDQIVDAFTAAREAIVEVASSTAEVVGQLGQRARRPDHLEVEFGLSFSAKGNVIVVGGETGAALWVKVIYDARQGE
ncbi:MAG: CU044_2847 family protein [Pseudonocardiaceae bacterium]